MGDKFLNVAGFRQMCGRAGRMGLDAKVWRTSYFVACFSVSTNFSLMFHKTQMLSFFFCISPFSRITCSHVGRSHIDDNERQQD